jgi:hypothetical protein
MVARLDQIVPDFATTRTRILAIPKESTPDRPFGCYLQRASAPTDANGNPHQIETDEIESVRFNANKNGASSDPNFRAICARPGADVYTYYDTDANSV